MFAYLKGSVTEKNFDEKVLVIEVANIGYLVNISLNMLAKVELNSEQIIFTYVSQSDSGTKIYGFLSKKEREIFKQLISVNGVGPKAGLNILDGLTVEDFYQAIINEDEKAISKANGVGAKTAKRLILELKNKLKIIEKVVGQKSNEDLNSNYIYVEEVLGNLGFDSQEIKNLVDNAQDKNIKDSEEMIRYCLTNAGKR